MWRELERQSVTDKLRPPRFLRELRPGDKVQYGKTNAAGVTVVIIDDNEAKVYALQRELKVTAGALEGRTMERPIRIMPATAELTIERQSIYISGDSVRGERIVEWYPRD